MVKEGKGKGDGKAETLECKTNEKKLKMIIPAHAERLIK